MGAIDTFKRHYQAMLDASGEAEHPADLLVSAMADVAGADRAAKEMAERLHPLRWTGDRRWLDYEDLRFQQRAIREERFLDIGYEMGRLAGLVESRAAATAPEPETLGRRLYEVIIASQFPPAHAAAVLLDTARALVLADRGAAEPTED